MASVDVVVPCYNYGRFLRECVGSVLAQDGVDVRVLILDDASSDGTPEVGRALAADHRVEYRRHAANRGHIATYNEGIDWLAGDYCLILSADDLLVPGALARAAAVMGAHPEVGFTYGMTIITDRPDPARDTFVVTPDVDIRTGPDFIRQVCEEGYNVVHGPTAIGRTAVQRAIGHFDPRLTHSGDMEMWLRYATRASVAAIGSHQAYYRTHATSMSLGYRGVKDLQQVRMAFRAIFDRHGAGLPADLRALADRRVADTAYGRAYKAFEQGDVGLCLAYTELARAANPRSRFEPKWVRLWCKRRLGWRTWSRVRRWYHGAAAATAGS
jgi:glycosyltransferase involved in cell wall biosynthesis